MAVAFRSVSSAHSGGGVTSFNCANPAGIAAGDVLVMVVHSWGGSPGTPASTGWTLNANHSVGGGDSYAVLTKVATGSEGANTTVTFSANVLANVGIVAYSGGSSVDAFADSVTVFSGGQATATPIIPSLTTTVANDIVVGVAISSGGGSATAASGWTERLDHTSPSSGGLVYAMEIAQPTAGASPSGATPTIASFSGIAWTYAVAVKPLVAVAPVADFTGTPLSGVEPLSVAFTDASTNTPTGWAWDFGDGGTSTSQNPTHSYTAAGTYTVALVASNSAGSNTKTRTGYVTVTDQPRPIRINTSGGWVDIADHSSFVSGSGAPTAAVGANGAIYLDVTSKKFYGPKAGGAWPGTAIGTLT